MVRNLMVGKVPGMLKRLLDVGVAIALGMVAMPIGLVAAALVAVSSGRPVIFRQARVGRDERVFLIAKFRTMSEERDADGRLLPDTLRMTSFGRFLRATSLDELPELWNVIRGDMSLVGPRPLPPAYLTRYTSTERRRHQVRPGLTGWAQVNGRNLVSWDERLSMDVWYVDHRSLRMDLMILLRTVTVVLRREGISAEGQATMTELRPPGERA